MTTKKTVPTIKPRNYTLRNADGTSRNPDADTDASHFMLDTGRGYSVECYASYSERGRKEFGGPILDTPPFCWVNRSCAVILGDAYKAQKVAEQPRKDSLTQIDNGATIEIEGFGLFVVTYKNGQIFTTPVK